MKTQRRRGIAARGAGAARSTQQDGVELLFPGRPVSTFEVTPAVGLSCGAAGEASAALSSAAQAALQSLTHAMASAEHQLQVVQEKQQQLLKLQQQNTARKSSRVPIAGFSICLNILDSPVTEMLDLPVEMSGLNGCELLFFSLGNKDE